MEQNGDGKGKYFIVTRGKARKGFSRGCVGRVDAETQAGELIGLVYGGGGNAKNSGMVKREDTYPLTRHQAQLLLFVSPASRRLELLCNPQLFCAICELAQDDLVVVRYKKGFQPCLVQNLMQIGKKDSPADLLMLGFQLQLVQQEPDQKVSSKKSVPLPVFSAGDIVQVAPAYQLTARPPLRDSQPLGRSGRPVSRINSMGSQSGRGKGVISEQGVSPFPTLSHYPLGLGSMVEVVSEIGVTVYGVIRWIGVPVGKKDDWAGIELDNEMTSCSDGTFGDRHYFCCSGNRALFVTLDRCMPDGRFLFPAPGEETPKPAEPPSVASQGEEDEDVPPIPEARAVALLQGRMKGIQGHYNSCYLDVTLFSLFSSSMALDGVCHSSGNTEGDMSRTLKRDIVNRLRRHGFVPAESVMNFRKLLGCESFVTEEKDPEEFITVLLERVLRMDPLLKIRSNGEATHGAYTYQIILEKSQVGDNPSVQQLLETSFLSCDLKFEEIPLCLMVQMPRFGKKFQMFPHIIPSTELDITDLLHCSPRECFLCGRMAELECAQCLPDRQLQPGRIKQYCSTCSTQVHTHRLRQGHAPRALVVPAEAPAEGPVPRHLMQLFAVLCIHTSHYVSFVKYGPNARSWLFFDSMAGRSGDDQNGHNVPEVKACPEVGDFLSRSEEELARVDPSDTGELVRRLLCDSYMCLYQSPSMALYR